MKVIIAGSRNFNNYDKLKKSCDHLLSNNKDTEIEVISGTAEGADSLGEYYASENGYNLKQFPAEWDKYGKGAGFRRNVIMAKYSECLIAFWDGKSRGTKHMINTAKKHGLVIKIIKTDE